MFNLSRCLEDATDCYHHGKYTNFLSIVNGIMLYFGYARPKFTSQLKKIYHLFEFVHQLNLITRPKYEVLHFTNFRQAYIGLTYIQLKAYLSTRSTKKLQSIGINFNHQIKLAYVTVTPVTLVPRGVGPTVPHPQRRG